MQISTGIENLRVDILHRYVSHAHCYTCIDVMQICYTGVMLHEDDKQVRGLYVYH